MSETSKNKNVRTKLNKSERIELRCTKAFKQSLNEIAVQNGMSLSRLLEVICTDKINKYYSAQSVQVEPKNETRPTPKTTSNQSERDKMIWDLMEKGMTPTETADWLNQNGYKPQRGEQFTINSVHSIRQRLKKAMNN